MAGRFRRSYRVLSIAGLAGKPLSMAHAEAHDPLILRSYEGLIFKTAQRIEDVVEEDIDDIRQVYRIKVYAALLRFDPERARVKKGAHRGSCRCARCRYVFSCVKNQEKDLLKKKRRGDLMLEDLAPTCDQEGFARHYLSTTHDEVYGKVDAGRVLLPNTLTKLEVEVICLLYSAYRQSEIARKLGLEKRDMERAMRSIRLKMEDWRPTADAQVVALPLAPVPALAAAA